MTLDEIGIKHGTDKASTHHGYLSIYEMLFRPWEHRDVRLLEIGIQFGLSLKTWRDWFHESAFYGIDIVDNHIEEENEFNLYYENAYQYGVIVDNGLDIFSYEIIIDDGSHDPKDQAYFVREYPKLLSENGIAIVEDIISLDVVELLRAALPTEFNSMTIDCRRPDNPPDSILFVAWRK